MGHLFVAYLKFKRNWAFYIFICYNWQPHLWGSIDHTLKTAIMEPVLCREVPSEMCFRKIALSPVGRIDRRVERFVGVWRSDGSIKKILLLSCSDWGGPCYSKPGPGKQKDLPDTAPSLVGSPVLCCIQATSSYPNPSPPTSGLLDYNWLIPHPAKFKGLPFCVGHMESRAPAGLYPPSTNFTWE